MAGSAWQPRHMRAGSGRQQQQQQGRAGPQHTHGLGGNPHGVCQCGSNREREDELSGGQVPGHTLRRSEVQPGNTLLGNHAQFCHAYWHMPDTPEAPYIRTPCCLRADGSRDGQQCAGKGVVLVARLIAQPAGNGSPPPDVYVARYSNCPDNEHAEIFFLRDQQLRSSLPAARGGRLLLYLNKQPCHHSSDHLRASSCTLCLLDFADTHLRPLGIFMEVITSYTYRAHWELENLNPSQRRRYGPAIVSAREGLRCFGCRAADGMVSIRATQPEDWLWLVAQCDDAVRDDYARSLQRHSGEQVSAPARDTQMLPQGHSLAPRHGLFSGSQFDARAAMDRFVQEVIAQWGGRGRGGP